MMFVPFLRSFHLEYCPRRIDGGFKCCSLLHCQGFGVHIPLIPLIPEEWPNKEAANQAVIRTWLDLSKDH